MTTVSTTQVLIVGAGPTGLTLACELAAQGVAVRMVEAAPGPQPGSRGKGVQPRTLELLQRLGVADRVIRHGRFAMPLRMTAPDGRVVTGGAEPESLRGRPDIPYTTSLITPEWRVEEALRARLTELGGRVEFGTALAGFAATDDDVTATVVTDGVATTIGARWLVGCDGGHSTVRKLARIGFTGETREDVRMIVADVAVDGLDREAWHLWRHDEGMVTLCPLPSTDLFQYGASVEPGQDPALTVANLQAVLERRSGRDDLRLQEPQWRSLWRANIRLADHYRSDRVLLAGDAAHIHSPAGGQGMNTGIQDAFNLAWKLAAVTRGASSALLDTYEDERRPVAEHVLGLSNARLERTIADRGMSTTRDTSTLQLDIAYRDSVLAHDDRADDAELRAGDRAPDATGLRTDAGTRTFLGLLGDGAFTLLCFGSVPAVEVGDAPLQVVRVTDSLRDSSDVVDTDGQLARVYAATSSTVVLIRPDGYLAVVSDSGDAAPVTRWFAALTRR